ncbi:hypothetical protein [Stenotrophomonas sp.]|uniref:hypothetical protein n=1 Tax=Stenotrophomonas sp. TaxID=69392 RepID=UPI0028A0AF7C|nr:hypothetical protein [Stenotrophomonas sp.]
MVEDLPPTDLARLVRDVADAEAALPRNLSNYWLELIARDLDTLQDGDEDGGADIAGPSLSGPLYLIIRILEARSGGEKMEISEEQLYFYFLDYQIEVNLELVSRNTELRTQPANLDTIFTDRDVAVFHHPKSSE